MEIFRGSLRDPAFQKWVDKLTERGKSMVVIAADDIYCYEAQRALKQTPLSIYISRSASVQDSFKRALIHIIDCNSERCRQFLQAIKVKAQDS